MNALTYLAATLLVAASSAAPTMRPRPTMPGPEPVIEDDLPGGGTLPGVQVVPADETLSVSGGDEALGTLPNENQATFAIVFVYTGVHFQTFVVQGEGPDLAALVGCNAEAVPSLEWFRGGAHFRAFWPDGGVEAACLPTIPVRWTSGGITRTATFAPGPGTSGDSGAYFDSIDRQMDALLYVWPPDPGTHIGALERVPTRPNGDIFLDARSLDCRSAA